MKLPDQPSRHGYLHETGTPREGVNTRLRTTQTNANNRERTDARIDKHHRDAARVCRGVVETSGESGGKKPHRGAQK